MVSAMPAGQGHSCGGGGRRGWLGQDGIWASNTSPKTKKRRVLERHKMRYNALSPSAVTHQMCHFGHAKKDTLQARAVQQTVVLLQWPQAVPQALTRFL